MVSRVVTEGEAEGENEGEGVDDGASEGEGEGEVASMRSGWAQSERRCVRGRGHVHGRGMVRRVRGRAACVPSAAQALSHLPRNLWRLLLFLTRRLRRLRYDIGNDLLDNIDNDLLNIFAVTLTVESGG